jgi:predicted GIY-YIG superfamily endonuclease
MNTTSNEQPGVLMTRPGLQPNLIRRLGYMSDHTTSQSHSVYVISALGTPLLKIGMSNNVQRRLARLSTASPHPLKVMAIFECHSRRDAHDLESTLHRVFKEQRANGEWFNVTPSEAIRVATHVEDLRLASVWSDSIPAQNLPVENAPARKIPTFDLAIKSFFAVLWGILWVSMIAFSFIRPPELYPGVDRLIISLSGLIWVLWIGAALSHWESYRNEDDD